MAKQTGFFKFTGKLGGVVGFRLGNEYYLRSMPEQVRQAPRTRISSRYFGQASNMGAIIRQALSSHLEVPRESSLTNRFNQSLLKILREDDLHRQRRFIPRHFSTLKGFTFTPWADIDHALVHAPVVLRSPEGKIHVSLQGLHEHALNPKATHVRIQALALSVDTKNPSAKTYASAPLIVAIGQVAEPCELIIDAPATSLHCIILQVTSLELQGDTLYPLQNRKYSYGAIIAVLMPEKDHATTVRPVYNDPAHARKTALPFVPGLVIHPPQLE
ncbi:hypothetical protein ACWKWU_08320 [Chitinophaga lutea]